METVLSIIGLFVVVKFCIKHRRVVMDRKAFHTSVNSLRRAIVKGWGNDFCHEKLDDIVHNVLGDEEVEDLDENLTEHIMQHIIDLKKAKEQEKLEAKAKGILEQIKAALDED